MNASDNSGYAPLVWLRGPGDAEPAQLPEFLHRELRLELDHSDSMKSLNHAAGKVPGLMLAHCHQDPAEVQSLSEHATRPTLLLVESDETFRPDLAIAIARRPSIRVVVRAYPIDHSGWRDLAGTLNEALRSIRVLGLSSTPSAARAWAAGVVIALRKARIRRILARANVAVVSHPLGYTNAFAEGVIALAREQGWRPIGKQESLIAYLHEHSEPLNSLKEDDVSFVGQRGKFQRQAILQGAQDAGLVLGPIRSGFQGGGAPVQQVGREYVASMARSRFTLCPPGNYSGEAFRLGESLLLGSLPIESPCVVSEPGWRPGRWTQGRALTRRTNSRDFSAILTMSETQRRDRVDSARDTFAQHVAGLRVLLADNSHGPTLESSME